MIAKEKILTQKAINFAARFGFINQEIFFKYFCENLKSQCYHYWSKLLNSGNFNVSSSDKHVLYLSVKGRRSSEFEPVPARNVYLIPHDSLVAKILLELEISGLVSESWTESELLRSPSTTYHVLGVNRIDKYPDLVIDLRANEKTLRFAFEIEHSRKAKERYDQMALNYLSMKNINLVVFGSSNSMITASIRRSFNGDLFIKNQKSPIIFSNEKFKLESFAVEAELIKTVMPLKKMILAALEAEPSAWQIASEKHQNSIVKIPKKSNLKNISFSKGDQDVTASRPSTGPLASFRDHPHPTMLIEGGHEPGAGVGRGPDRTGEEEK